MFLYTKFKLFVTSKKIAKKIKKLDQKNLLKFHVHTSGIQKNTEIEDTLFFTVLRKTLES
jgi:hypothetical protein